MRFFRLLLVLAVSLTAVGALSAPAAFASQSVFTKDGQPSCTVTTTSSSSSSTTCTGALRGEDGVDLLANVDVSGVAVYQCQDSTGATVPGQNQVRADGGSSTSFTPSKKNPGFTTDLAVLAAPSTVSASQAGCPDGSTAVEPTLTTTSVQLLIAATLGPIIFNCTVPDLNGLSGTIPLAC